MLSQRFTCAALVALACLAVATATPRDVLASTDFRDAAQSWSLSKLMGSAYSTMPGLELDLAQNVVKSKDTDNTTWYFTSPESGAGILSLWPGDRAQGYNGVLKVFLQHLEWSGDFVPGQNDIVINCRPKFLSMGIKGIFNDGDTAVEYNVPLNTSAPWRFTAPKYMDTVSGAPRVTPTTAEFVQCLQGLTGIRVRGGQYSGPEKTQLRSLKVLQGAVDESQTEEAYGLVYDADAVAAANPGCCGEQTCTSAEMFEIQWTQPGTCSPEHESLANAKQLSYFCGQNVGPAATPLSPGQETKLAFKGVPLICSTATLTVSVDGPQNKDLTYPVNHLIVYSESGAKIGSVFETVTKEVLETKGGMYNEDTIAISAETMQAMSSDGQVEFGFRVMSQTDTPIIRKLSLRFSGGHCYRKSKDATRRLNAVNDGRAHPILLESTFSVPKGVVPGGDGILSIGIQGRVGTNAWLDVTGENNATLGTVFKEHYSSARSGTFITGTAESVIGSMVQLRAPPAGDPSLTPNWYAGMFFALRSEDGNLQESVKIASSSGIAPHTITLVSGVDVNPTKPYPRFVIHDLTNYPLVTVSGGFVPRSQRRHVEYVRIPRKTLAAWAADDGKVSLSLSTTRSENSLDEAVIGPVTLIFPPIACHTDSASTGFPFSQGLLRPSSADFTFSKAPPMPASDATLTISILFQDHELFTPINTHTSVRSDGEYIVTDVKQYPFGFGAIAIKAGFEGETLGYILRDDFSLYDPTKPYTTTITIPMERMAVYAGKGELRFTLVVPPGTGVVRMEMATIAYPIAST